MDLNAFDTALSRKPFGDSPYVREQMHLAFKRRLEGLGASTPAARHLLTALQRARPQTEYRALGDPLLRQAVQQLLAQEVAGPGRNSLSPELCAQVIEAVAQHVETGAAHGPLQGDSAGAQWLGDPTDTPWIYSPGPDGGLLGQTFDRFVEQQFAAGLHRPDESDLERLRQGYRLLGELLPLTSRSALSHTHLIGITSGTDAWKGKASSSQFTMVGIVFLNRKLLQNPWWVAEHLFHEALHQKLYDFRHAHSMLVRDLDDSPHAPTEVRRVVSLWNVPGLDGSNRWNAHRTMAAFHVYVHLALLCSLAEQHAPRLRDVYGPLDAPSPMTPSRKAFERARYLAESLRAECWDELGLAGQRMVDWLNAVLDAMDQAPPPPGSFLHLILDRYLKEARRLRKAPVSDDLATTLAALGRSEAETFREVLSAVGAEDHLHTVTTEPAPRPAQEHETGNHAAFAHQRHHIADTLLRLAPNGYSLDSLCRTPGPSADEMVRVMVEASSRELAATSTRPDHQAPRAVDPGRV
ncbi:hypothetical protein ACFYM0_36715 [Streptomyces sp. NPDC006487]|uniref:hypothetical protein n=1 Tax=Streptomyces sp. NPDC006487 TaxID=3364748 RepID=UPI0036848612